VAVETEREPANQIYVENDR